MRSADLGPNDLVLCSGTLLESGIREMADAAEAGGYRGLTLWPQDVQRAHADGLSDSDIRSLLSDKGLVVADLDPLLGWTPEAVPEPGQAIVDITSEDEFFDLAEAFGARSLNAVQAFGNQLDLDAAAEDLAGLCDRAKEHGLLVTIEFLPWSGIPNAAVAYDLISRAGSENATILVDTWHWFRGGADLEMLRSIPGNKIGSVQLNDAPTDSPPDIMIETVEARLMPGEGDIPIADVIRVLDEIGSVAPIGIEVFNARHARMAPIEVGVACAEATRKVLGEARGQ